LELWEKEKKKKKRELVHEIPHAFSNKHLSLSFSIENLRYNKRVII